MAINFPNAPVANQKFTSGNTLYTFVNGAWVASPLGTARPKNYMVNPNLRFSQINGDTGLTGTGQYPADTWFCAFSGVVVPAFYRATSVTPNGTEKCITMQLPAKPSLAAGDYAEFQTNFEGLRVVDFQFGTAAAKQAVLAFGVYAGVVGNFGVSMRNIDGTRSCTSSFNIAAGETGKWVRRTCVFPGDTAGTWPIGNAGSMTVAFVPAAGSAYISAAAGVWSAGNFLVPPGMTNGAATATAISFSDVGLYLDPNLTGRAPLFEPPFERPAYSECQRYIQKCPGAIGIAISNTTTHQRASYPNQAPMRAVPAISIAGTLRAWDQATAPNITGIATPYSNRDYFEFNFTSASAQTLGRGAMLIDYSGANYLVHNARP